MTEYYTVDQFAELMNLSPQTIRRSIKSGRISAIRVGISKKASYRIPKHQIDKLYQLTNLENKEGKDGMDKETR